MALVPGDVSATSHCPADTMATHELVPSLIVTSPVSGAPTAPRPLGETVHCTVTGCPASDGSGASKTIAVVVPALPTITVFAPGELLLSLLSTTTSAGSTRA